MKAGASKYGYEVTLDAQTTAARVLRMVGTNKSVLEIGCASGSQTRALKEQMNCSVTAIEIDPSAAAKAQAFSDRLLIGDVESPELLQQLGTTTFDVVLLSDVLEHLRDPKELLRRIKAFVHPHGWVVASIPNVVHASVIYEMARGRFDYQLEGLLDETHVRFFTKQSALATFEDAGYIVETVDRVIVNPSNTEFQTRPVTKEDEAFLEYILANNAEARTYQFLLKALPATCASEYLSTTALRAQDRIAALEKMIDDQCRMIRRLESELGWVDRHLLLRLLRAPKRLLTRTK
jgi:2-polyprenyl-3-methyl-5-hydroxy-6-metoxy-1,4-benzoquinol methylase